MKATIRDVRNLINQSQFNVTLNVTRYNDDATTTVLQETFSGSLIFRTLLTKFASWKWITYGDNLTDCAIDLIEQWEDYISINKYYLERQLSALKTEFNPAWNYDKHNSIKNEYGEAITENEYGKTKTENEYGETKTENDIGERVDRTPKMTTTNSESPQDSESFYSTTKTEVDAYNLTSDAAHDESVIRNHTDTITGDAHTDKVTSKQHEDNMTQREYGNIGVMTSTQAINEVLDTYQRAFLTMLIEGFRDEYLYL